MGDYQRRRTLRILLGAMVPLDLYVIAYLVLRSQCLEVWPRDGHDYVIVPVNTPWVYSLFRPLMLLDACLTGMRFHIGPHHPADPPRL